MSITKHFIYILSFGIILLAFAAIANSTLIIFIIYSCICVTILILDYFISIDEALISVERQGEFKLSIYEREAICFQVHNRSEYKLYIQLKDEIPDFHFEAEKKLMYGCVLPHEKKVFRYFVIPEKRGAFTFKNIYIRYEGRLRLSTKTLKLNIPGEYKVYPNMKNLRKYRLSVSNNRMLKEGLRSLKMQGRGTSFESLRDYVTGDEYKKINWKATGRRNKLIVNQYEPEKNQHVYMFIDTGRPMSYTLQGYRKLDLVVNTALVLSDIVNQNGDQSGLLLFNTEIDNMLRPGKGASHRNKMMEALYHIDHTNKTSNYDDAFYYFKKKERHRSIIFLFTDFDTLEEAENILKVLPVITNNNLVIIILIKNEGLESISTSQVKNKEDLFNKGMAMELLDERKKIINLLNRKGFLCIECVAEKLEYMTINKYIQVKNRAYL